MPHSADPDQGPWPVVALDAKGDGVARLGPQSRSVPFALPGDTVTFGPQGLQGAQISETSPLRVPPPCPLFAACGGCRTLHLEDEAYARWKVERVTSAFRAAGVEVAPAPLVRSPLASRRRLTFTARSGGKGVTIGYFARGTHDVVDVADCPALAPPLRAALTQLREIGAAAASRVGEVRLQATLCENGIDVALTPPKRWRGKTPALPLADSVLRITFDGEPLIAREEPVVRFGDVSVAVPPGAFLQATREGERALTAEVVRGVAGARRVLDAFCGLGTFTFALSQRAAVSAVDVDGPAIAALEAAARTATGGKPVTTMRRNLMRHPLSAKELSAFDAVVFDPPRAGAKDLCAALARSRVPTLVAVSCEPATLARDCAILLGAGYKITHVLPVDQFVATAHIECVVTLRRDR